MLKMLLILIIVFIIFLTVSYVLYFPYIRNAYKRVESIKTTIANTICGTIEYVTHGTGFPVLVVHGIWGGFDQGLVEVRLYPKEFKYIIVSRYGYLGTPMPINPSVASQADLFASLLDSLGIQSAAIIGISAGGPSAVQFALRHPGRCKALILISSRAPKCAPEGPKIVLHPLAKSDFLLWLILNYSRSTMISMIGVPSNLKSNLSPQDQRKIDNILETILPVVPRTKGILFDAYVSNPDMDTYIFENVSVPTLTLHAKDDPLSTFVSAELMTRRIAKACFVSLDKGGHLLLGQQELIETQIRNFLIDHIPSAADSLPIYVT